jgi:hypothetical protein
MWELLNQYIPADLVAAIVAALVALGAVLAAMAKFVGACSMIVAVLNRVLPRMQAWAERTETSADNAVLGLVATFLAMAGPKLDWLRARLEGLALNNAFKARR